MADTNGTDIHIEVEPPAEPEPVQESAPVTVIETDGGSDGIDPAIMQELLDLREEKVRNETRIAELETATLNAQVAAEVTAVAVAEQREEVQAVADAIEEIREGEQSGAELDEEPHREHGFFRPLGRRD